MKIDVKQFIVKLLAVLLSSLICWCVFNVFDLDKLFGAQVSFLQWIGISIISTMLFVNPIVKKEE